MLHQADMTPTTAETIPKAMTSIPHQLGPEPNRLMTRPNQAVNSGYKHNRRSSGPKRWSEQPDALAAARCVTAQYPLLVPKPIKAQINDDVLHSRT
jgi:hypothetical protein